MTRTSIFWGAILTLLGILLLLSTLGILYFNIWTVIWPLFLVALGIWILWGSTMGRRPAAQETVAIPLDGAERARISMGHGAGHLSIASGADPANLVSGTAAGGLDFRTRKVGDTLEADLRVPNTVFPFWWGPGTTLDWDLRLSSNLPLRLDLNTGAGETSADLSSLDVEDLRLQTGASSTHITLPANAGFTSVRVGAGAASVNLEVPSGVAARIQFRTGLAGIRVDQERFPRQGAGMYQSPDYDTATNKIDLDIQTGVGSVDVH